MMCYICGTTEYDTPLCPKCQVHCQEYIDEYHRALRGNVTIIYEFTMYARRYEKWLERCKEIELASGVQS